MKTINKLKELATALWTTWKIALELVIIILWAITMVYIRMMKRMYLKCKDTKAKIAFTWIWVIGVLIVLSIFFPPEARSLQFKNYEVDNKVYNEVLSFNPHIPENHTVQEWFIMDLGQPTRVDKWVQVTNNYKTLIRKNTRVTSYNAEAGQTDSTPCIAGGTGYNICDMAKRGERTIALSQELIQWSMYGGKNAPFKKGDILIMESTDYPDDSRCNGRFIVADAMNARFTNRADLFFMNRKDNTSCYANIYKLNNEK